MTHHSIHNALHNTWRTMQYMTHHTIHDAPHNTWRTTQYMTHHTIHGAPHNTWRTTQYITHRTIHDAPHNAWHTAQYMTHHTIHDTLHNITLKHTLSYFLPAVRAYGHRPSSTAESNEKVECHNVRSLTVWCIVKHIAINYFLKASDAIRNCRNNGNVPERTEQLRLFL